jgi:hypothetical protein
LTSAGSRTAPLPPASLLILGAQGAALLLEGALLFAVPETGARFWPWPLTPLTARAVGAWLFAIGVAAVHGLIERDAERLSVGALGYVFFGMLQLVALARYGGELRWGSPTAWGYVAFIVTALAMGAAGLLLVVRGPAGLLRGQARRTSELRYLGKGERPTAHPRGCDRVRYQ